MEWADRPDWPAVPAPVRDGIEALLGARVQEATTPPGGHCPQLAAILTLDDGRRVFAKSAPATSEWAAVARREAAVTATLPAAVPAPALLVSGLTADWFTAVFTVVEGRHPDLRPGSPDLASVLDALAATAAGVVSPSLRESVRGTADGLLAGYLHGWEVLAADPPADLDPWAAARLADLTDRERRRSTAMAGTALGHSDARPDNMLIHGGAVTLVDWANALIGAPWLDAAFLAPLLVLRGWPPAAVLAQLNGHPLLAGAEPGDPLTFWVALTGYWQRSCRLPAPHKSPGIRPYQRRAAAAGVALLRNLLG